MVFINNSCTIIVIRVLNLTDTVVIDILNKKSKYLTHYKHTTPKAHYTELFKIKFYYLSLKI